MNVFSITADNKVVRLSSEQATAPGVVLISSAEELGVLVRDWPMARLVQVWNQLPSVTVVRRFTDHKTAIRRLWAAVDEGSQPGRHEKGSKRRATDGAGGKLKPGHRAGKGTKTEKILTLLRRPSGVTLTGLIRATHW